MSETLLVALGDSDRDRIDDFADEVDRLAGEDVTIVAFHAFESEEYVDRARKAGLNEFSSDAAVGLAQEYEPIQAFTEAMSADRDVKVHGASTNDVPAAILRAGRQVDADQLVLGGRQRTPVGKATFGSTAQRVLLQADRPVTVLRMGEASAMRTLRNAI